MQPALRQKTAELPAHDASAELPVRGYIERRNWVLGAVLDLLLILPVVAFICFYDLGSPSIHYRDETTHVRAIQEMRQSGDWTTPMVRGKPYFNKPPFKMWLTFIPLAVFGESAFSYRFLDALAGVLTCTLLYLFGRRFFCSRIAGIAAALAMILCPAYVFGHGVRKAVQDSMLILLSTGALMLGFEMLKRLHETPWKPTRALALGCGTLLGLGLLTKGAGGALPVLIAGVYVILSGRAPTLLGRDRHALLLTALPAVTIPALYMVPHFLFTPGAFATMFGAEVVSRATEGYHNREELWFYFIEIFRDRQALPPELLTVSLGWAALKAIRDRSSDLLFLLVWALFPLVFFTCIPSRLSWYVAPAFPAMALIFGGATGAAVGALRRRLPLWWDGLGSLRLTDLALAGFLAASALLLANNFAELTRPILHPRPKLQIDHLVTEMLRHAAAHPETGRILVVGTQEFALHESTYGGMIEPLVTRAADTAEGIALVERGGITYAFASIESFTEFHRAGKVTSYRYMPPLYDRGSWLVAFTVRDTPPSPHFSPTKRLISFGRGKVDVNFGFGESAHAGVHSFRKAEQEVAISLSGDPALKRFGSEMRLNFSVRTREPSQVRILLNGHEAAAPIMSQGNMGTLTMQIPPLVWQNGRNTLLLTIRSEDGAALPEDSASFLLNWLAVDLSPAP